MHENPLLATLAKLCGDITLANNINADEILRLQQILATAIINDPALPNSNYRLAETGSFSPEQLQTIELQHLGSVLQKIEEAPQAIDKSIRVFRREVPFVSSQQAGSVPDWGRGGQITETLGPFLNNDGIRVWFDLYRIIPVVQVWLQGGLRPFMLIPLQVRNILVIVGPREYKIPKGSVWISADLFANSSPDNLYCGLTIADGEIKLSGVLNVTADNKLTLPAGMTASVLLNLEQKVINDVSPDNNGIDIKEATIDLPKTLSISFSHTGRTIEAAAATWNIYGQPVAFTYDAARPPRWNAELNRVAISYKTDVTIFEVLQSKSPVCSISGKAQIADAAWAISAAAIDIAAPVEADGTGAMAIGVLDGLEAGWAGLKDAALEEKTSIRLNNALVMLMPGRINIATLFASAPTARQRYNLWQDPPVNGKEAFVQYIDLFYSKQFYFFYDNLQKGTENISTQTSCTGNVNKPVKVDGRPFDVESLQTIFTLSISQATQILMLYDNDIIRDNWSKTIKQVPGAALPPVSFESTAIALNNALLTVSPVYGLLVYGDLKSDDEFDKCLVALSFGLLQYLPTLPDPYAANVSLLRRRKLRANNLQDNNKYFLTDITALLVCNMTWINRDEPAVNFFLGDKPANANLAGTFNTIAASQPPVLKLEDLKNGQVLDSIQRSLWQRYAAIQAKEWTAVTDDAQGSSSAFVMQAEMMMTANRAVSRGDKVSLFSNAFTLLDVSTAADLMGVSLAFSNDDFVFERTHTVREDIQGNPLSIDGLDVQATSRLVQIYALPQISWEPMITNSDVVNTADDPYPGILYFLNDGVPVQIANTGNKPVTLAPLPLTERLTTAYKKEELSLWSYFTLSNGMMALGMYYTYEGKRPVVELIKEKFPGEVSTGLQLKTVGYVEPKAKNSRFKGSVHQLANVNNLFIPVTNNRSVLSGSVTRIFNREFGTLTGFDPGKIMPLERYDFSGYGANVFSHWLNPKAALAQTSQAMFDVWRGRTAHEVIQVKSVIYPWGIRVVRTITIYRGSNGFPWRTESGWKAESDGIYDFRSPVEPGDVPDAVLTEENKNTYAFHPGMVEGVYNVRNIKEDPVLLKFQKPWLKDYGLYIDNDGLPKAVKPPAAGQPLEVDLVPVYFDADVEIDNVTQGATDGRVLGQHMLGYLQLSPRGVFIAKEDFASLLTLMQGLGGPVDCLVNINDSGQPMRITRVDVNPGFDAGGNRVFISAAKGTPVLPKDGSWTVVQHNLATKEVLPLAGNDVIPLVREGERIFIPEELTYKQNKTAKPVNVAEAGELFKPLESRAKQYGFLQSTGENKVLFRNPLFENGVKILKGSMPDLADAYHLMNSKGIFPKLEGLPSVAKIGSEFEMQIKEKGFELMNKIDPLKKLEQKIEGDWYLINTPVVKLYIEYLSKDNNGAPLASMLNLDINSTASAWVNKMNDISMNVDLGTFKKILTIRGKFQTEKGKPPSFIEPIMEFGEKLRPVYDILVLLSELSINSNYKDILVKGLKIAMSNSPNNWEYKFQADKEIPVVRFPPANLDTAAAPLRLEANLRAGVYFNVAIPIPPTNGIQAPSAGAFVEFYAKLSVMCLSVGVGSIYAVGQATVRISGDSVAGPALYMKFGFGVEAVVALPVLGSVSVYFAVGVEMLLSSTEDRLGGFVLFRGRAEILGGIVTVTIQIEASGQVQKRIGQETNMIAQVTFSLDISVCFIIDISFTEHWEETKQLA
jgi:hypothetical protein